MPKIPSFAELIAWLESGCCRGSPETLPSAHPLQSLQSRNSNGAFNGNNNPPAEGQMWDLPESNSQATSNTEAQNISDETPPNAMLATRGMATLIEVRRAPALSYELHDVLNRELPNRANYEDEMLQLGRELSQNLRALRTEFEKARRPHEAEQAVINLLEIIMSRWHSVNQPHNSEIRRLRFLASKLNGQLKMLRDGL